MEELLKIQDLSVEYRTGDFTTKAVSMMSFTIHKGEALGLVGESGAGKTTTALSILGLLPNQVGFITGGDIIYKGQSLIAMKEKELNSIRGGKIAMVFANPLSSLNPVFTIGHQVSVVARNHLHISKFESQKKAAEILHMVGIPEYRMNDYPHQFSGGMRQRVGIAAALICSPELMIMDEPTTALDVTIQAQILELMKDLQNNFLSSLLMISHNLGIIAELCQKVAVMYAGEIIEYGTVHEVFEHPCHHYTVGLLNAIPKLYGLRERLVSIPGNVANPRMLLEGCKFHKRCNHCTDKCKTEKPPMVELNEGHCVRCWRQEGDA
jgi:peptide/nickel transport system ATP-binding protein